MKYSGFSPQKHTEKYSFQEQSKPDVITTLVEKYSNHVVISL